MQELHISGYFFYFLQILETINLITVTLSVLTLLIIPFCLGTYFDIKTNQFEKQKSVIGLTISILIILAAIFLPSTKNATYMYAEYLVQTQKFSPDQQLNVESIYQKIREQEKSK